MNEVVTSDEELQMRTKAMIQKETESKDTRGRSSLGERIRAKFHNTFYGNRSPSSGKDGEPSEAPSTGGKRELDRLIE